MVAVKGSSCVSSGLGCCYWLLRYRYNVYVRWTPQPVIVTTRDNRDYIRVLLYSSYTTITGWGVLLIYVPYTGSRGGNVDGGHLAPPVKEQSFIAHPNQSD